jgi:hypothetical protein
MSDNHDAIFVGAKIPKELHQRLERAAQMDFRSLSKTLIILVTEALETREAKRDRKKG